MQRTNLRFAMLSVLMSGAAFAGPADPVFLEDDRNVFSWVWISGCPSETQTDSAQDFEAFHAAFTVDDVCNNGTAAAASSQDSYIEQSRIVADGLAEFEASATQSTVIHAMGRSRCSISFSLSEARQFWLGGEIAAARAGSMPGYFATVTLQLSGPGGPIASSSLQPTPGESLSETISEYGMLEPGTYLLTAHAQAYADASFNGTQASGTASFNFVLDLPAPLVPGDATGDGLVNVDDLLAVISAWGACEPKQPCPADLNASGDVEVMDLLLVISNWT